MDWLFDQIDQSIDQSINNCSIELLIEWLLIDQWSIAQSIIDCWLIDQSIDW